MYRFFNKKDAKKMDATIGAMGMQALGMMNAQTANSAGRQNTKDYMQWQNAHNKDLTEFNKNQQLDLWNKTNYEAQRKHMEKAGLNIGLMYGMGGSGGAQGTVNTQGVSGSGSNAPMAPTMDITNAIAKDKEMKLMDAQINKTNAEAENLRGADRDLKGSQTALNQIEEKIKNIDFKVKNETSDKAIESIVNQANKLYEELEISATNNEINRQTADAQINIVKAKEVQALLDQELSKKQYEKYGAEIESILKGITQKDRGLDYEGSMQELKKELETRNLDLQEYRLWLEAGKEVLRIMTRQSNTKTVIHKKQ